MEPCEGVEHIETLHVHNRGVNAELGAEKYTLRIIIFKINILFPKNFQIQAKH